MENFIEKIKNKCLNRIRYNAEKDIMDFAHKNFLHFSYEHNNMESSIKFHFCFGYHIQQGEIVSKFYKYMHNKYCKNQNVFYCNMLFTSYYDHERGYTQAERISFVFEK